MNTAVGNVAHTPRGGIVDAAVKPLPMLRPKREYVVVSLGGSLVVPDGIDSDFLAKFKTTILRAAQNGTHFYVVVGGGKTARRYQEAAQAVSADVPQEEADWLGIHATRLNAHLVRTLFLDETSDRIVKNPLRAFNTKYPIIVGGGWRPGNSTDYCAVIAAKKLGAKKIVNLSNIDYVYDKNPRDHADAKRIEQISWSAFRKLIPEEWHPGLSSPFDPVAAKEAEILGLEVAVINGSNLEALENYLAGKPFTGSTIS